MPLLKTRKTMITSAAALAALLLVPATGSAATNFGSRLLNDPTSADCQLLLAPCSVVSFIQPSDPAGDPYSGGAPVSGVITKFRIRAYGNGAPATVAFRVGNLTPAGDLLSATGSASPIGASATVAAGPTGTTPIIDVPGRVPVTAGQHLAVDGSTNLVATYDSSGSKFSYVFSPPLAAGGSSAVTGELLVAASIEPDADKDGFGDETQDGCPSDGSTQGSCVTGLKVSGRKISYSLSAASTVKFALAKATKGRKVSGKCVRKTRKNRKKKSCIRYVKSGATFSGSGKAGANTAKLRKLKPGKYQLTITVTDAANRATIKTKNFTVKKARHKKK